MSQGPAGPEVVAESPNQLQILFYAFKRFNVRRICYSDSLSLRLCMFLAQKLSSKMTDPLRITASVIDITTAAIESVKFLHTTISDIKDVLATLENIRSDLQIVKPILGKLRIELESEDF